MEEITRKDFLHSTVNTLIGLWVAATAVLSSYAGLRYLWPTEKTAGGPGGNKASSGLTKTYMPYPLSAPIWGAS